MTTRAACGAAVAPDGEDGRRRHAARRRAPLHHGARARAWACPLAHAFPNVTTLLVCLGGTVVALAPPFLQDLGSTNGTFLNGERLEAQKFFELLHQDALRFGHSSREYVVIDDSAAK